MLNNQIYIGSTNDLKKRVDEHNSGALISTKRYRPLILHYYEAYKTESLARLREKRLKYHGNAIKELKKRVGLIKSGAGFTLVELLVVIAVLSLLGVLVLSIFTSSLRGSNKSQILLAIKQNGQSVLEQMDKTVRNAKYVVCPAFINPSDTSTSSNSMVVVSEGIYTRYRLISPIATDNGLIQKDNPTKQIDPSTNQEETDPVFVLRVCNPTDPMSSPVVLTDTKPDSGVSIECSASDCNTNPIFLRNRSSGFRDQVMIKFIVKQGKAAPAAVAGQIDPVTFQTTIELR